LEVAKYFEDNGIQHLHLVDLDGAKSNQIINHKILNEIASKTNLKIDFGGFNMIRWKLKESISALNPLSEDSVFTKPLCKF
jgi:phosphoribosylformimino-5-aminoimidazole carboxamide ribonucleotide (ProFAR) isomerase